MVFIKETLYSMRSNYNVADFTVLDQYQFSTQKSINLTTISKNFLNLILLNFKRNLKV